MRRLSRESQSESLWFRAGQQTLFPQPPFVALPPAAHRLPSAFQRGDASSRPAFYIQRGEIPILNESVSPQGFYDREPPHTADPCNADCLSSKVRDRFQSFDAHKRVTHPIEMTADDHHRSAAADTA